MLALPIFLDLFTPPDPAIYECYLLSLLFILLYNGSPHHPPAHVHKLSLLPFLLWQAWRCAVGLNFSVGLALSLGVKLVKDGERLNH